MIWGLALNGSSLDEWGHFAASRLTFREAPAHPLDCAAHPLFCQLSAATTEERRSLLGTAVRELGFSPIPVPIRGGREDIVVRLEPRPGEPYIVLSAHYDKVNPENPAALDNTAGIYSLYLLLKNLSAAPPRRNVVVSFSGEEETGFYGALALLDWMAAERLKIDSVLVVDSIGRGHPYMGAIGQGTGIYYRDWRGRERRWSPWGRRVYPYVEPDTNLSRRLAAAAKEAGVPFRTYNRMVGWSEDVAFAQAGHPTARLYSDDWWYYFHYIDTPDDKPEYIDAANLEEFVRLYAAYINP